MPGPSCHLGVVWGVLARPCFCCCVAPVCMLLRGAECPGGKQFLATITGASRVGRQEILMMRALLATVKFRGMRGLVQVSGSIPELRICP